MVLVVVLLAVLHPVSTGGYVDGYCGWVGVH